MTTDCELEEGSRLLGCKTVESQVFQNRQIWKEEWAEGEIHMVDHPGLSMALKKMSMWRKGRCPRP